MEPHHPCSIICKKRRSMLHVSSPMCGNGVIYHPLWLSCIGWLWNNATTKFHCTFTKHWMAWHLPIWLTFLYHTSTERTWGLLVNITLVPHVYSLKRKAIERSCWPHQDCRMNYQETSGVPNPLKFSRPTYICRPFIDEVMCPLVGLS